MRQTGVQGDKVLAHENRSCNMHGASQQLLRPPPHMAEHCSERLCFRATALGVKTEHLVARTFFSVLSHRACLTTVNHAHVCVAQGSRAC